MVEDAAKLARDIRQNPDPAGDRIAELVRLATLAANSHNTQPWLFDRSESGLLIRPDFARRCSVVDPDDHHLWASLGAAGEAAVIGAGALGWAAECRWTSEGAEISLRDDPSAHAPLLDALLSRQCLRVPFDPAPLAASALDRLARAGETDGVACRLVTDRADLAALTEMVAQGNQAQFTDPKFLAELRQWIRFSTGSTLGTRDGLSAATTGNRFAPDWLGQLIFRFVVRPSSEDRKLREQMAGTAAVVVLSAETNDPRGWFAAGRATQELLLAAEAEDIAAAFINQPVEVAALRDAFAERFGTPRRRPDIVLRLGRRRIDGPVRGYSLRRRVADVLAAS